MTMQEYGSHRRSTWGHSSSSSSPKGGHLLHSYTSRGASGIPQHYSSSSLGSNSHHREYGQHEFRRSPYGYSSNDCTSTSQHHHTNKHQPVNNNYIINNDARKRATPICTSNTSPSEPQEPWNNTTTTQHKASTTRTAITNNHKRARSNSSDESSNDIGDIRHESSSKYGNMSTYNSTERIYTCSRGDDSLRSDLDHRDHGHHRSINEHGKDGYISSHRDSKEEYINSQRDDNEHGKDGGFNSSHRNNNKHGKDGYTNSQGRSSRHHSHEDPPADAGLDFSVFCRKKLWVGGLPSDITCADIRKYFEAYGELVYVMISPRGNAFVKFTTQEQAFFAYRKCYTAYIREKFVKVKYAIRRANKIPHNKLLYINNVPSSLTRTDLKKEFEKYGQIEDVQVFTVPYLYFFVTFKLEDSAVKARKALKTKYFIQFGKNRSDEKKSSSESPEASQSIKAPPDVPLIDISECDVCDVLEPLSDDQISELSELLNGLEPTNSAIRVRRDWILEHAAHINDILLHISVMLVAKDNPYTLRLSTLFLIHDLLSYCTQRRTCTEILDTVSALTLPHVQRVISKFHVDSEEESKSVLNILSLWERYSVFPVTVVEDLCLKFKAGEQGSPTDDVW